MSAVVYVLGCRPNFVKVAPVYHEMRRRAPDRRHVLAHTGQHYDPSMSGVFLDELGLPEPDHLLAIGSGTHGEQTGRALERLERVFSTEEPALVVVAGDVNSTLAGALAAAKLDIPIAHVESGLRSFDWRMPEEVNRVLTDRLSNWCLTHSPEADENLRREGIDERRICRVGNTMIDSLVRLRKRIDEATVIRELSLVSQGYVLVTLHRPELVDGPLLEPMADALARLAERIPVIFPLHPRTRARVRPQALGRVRVVEPQGYIDFLALQSHAAAVVTDSGGVQEETTFLGVPCYTVRESTERPITVTEGTNQLLGLDPEAIVAKVGLTPRPGGPVTPPELWDGRAGARAADILLHAIEN